MASPSVIKALGLIAGEDTPLLIPPEPAPQIKSDEKPVPAISSSPAEGEDEDEDEDEEKPLPATQILLLCIARLVEPIAFFGIFPFINKMIWETGGLEEADVGFYSGLIESFFSFTQMMLMISWGRAADRIGRKPVLVSSLCGIALASSIFGLSKSIPQMVIFRGCAGIFAGTVVTIRTMLTENSTARTQARAFSLFAFSGNVGIFLGPLLGGAFSNPAEQYPSLFGRIEFFKDFPYALPTFVNGSIAAIAALLCGLFLKETLKRKDGNEAMGEPLMSTSEIVQSPGVLLVIALYSHIMFLGLGYTALLPVFWFSDPEIGGCGFTPMQISLFLALIGVSQAIWLLLIFPPLQRKFGTVSILRGSLYMWPVMLMAGPFCNMLLRRGWERAFWIAAPAIQILGSGVAMGYTAVQLALNDVSPTPQTLGTLNAVALTLTSGIRTVGPAAITSLFAIGAKTQLFAGHLAWVVLAVTALAGPVLVSYLPEQAEGKLKKKAVNQRGS